MRRYALLSAFLLAPVLAFAQPQEFRPDEKVHSTSTESMRINEQTGFPLVVFGTAYRSAAATPEARAREYLANRGAELGIDASAVIHTATRETPGGFRVRFKQVVSGMQVFHSDIVISLSHSGRVAFVVNGFRPGLRVSSPAPKSTAAAVSAARDYLGITTRPQLERVSTVVYPYGSRARVAHKVELVAQESLQGDWEVLIDADSGEIFRAMNRAQTTRGRPADHADHADQANPGTHRQAPLSIPDTEPAVDGTRFRTDGSGWVFDPDPLSSSRGVYGAAITDNDDADSQELTDQLVQVTLRDITFDGTTYFLEGPYARIHDTEVPIDSNFAQLTSDWHFTRGEDAFEAVNAYYHIDKSMRYINETLGFALMPTQYTGGVLIDPHGANGQDQSFYSGGVGSLTFGEGGVDDAEDADVLLHELGHGLHDWVTNGGLSQVEGLSEGFGDYWANSYSRGTGSWDEADDQRAWVFHWDGHNEFWSGRTAAYEAHYPEGLVDQIHTDGQIWASSVMEIWELLGRETTDLLMLEAMSMTGSASSQADAAFAFLQADSLLNGGANSSVISEVFLRRGYILQANFAVSRTAGPLPLTVSFTDVSASVGPSISARAWDFDGDGVTDATGQLEDFTYTEPGLYTVSLTVTAGANETTITRQDFISVNEGVYLWQGGPGKFDRSGDYLRNQFLSRGVISAYAHSDQMHAPLTGYDAVFLSLGSFSTGATQLSDIMATQLTEYIEAGGSVYLEGSEALGFDQRSNSAFLALFGLAGVVDGANSPIPPVILAGQTGALTDGMLFLGTSQTGTTWIDQFTPQAPAIAAFVVDGFDPVAVQNETLAGGKTFVSSYALGHLDDGAAPSTRVVLLDRILEYFGIDSAPTAVEGDELPAEFTLSPSFPNPFATTTTLTYELPRASRVSLVLFNTLGQRVAVVERGRLREAGSHTVRVDASQLPAGTYFARLEASGQVRLQPLVIVR